MKEECYYKCIAFNEKAASFMVEVRQNNNQIAEVSVLVNKSKDVNFSGRLTQTLPKVVQEEITKNCLSIAKSILWK